MKMPTFERKYSPGYLRTVAVYWETKSISRKGPLSEQAGIESVRSQIERESSASHHQTDHP